MAGLDRPALLFAGTPIPSHADGVFPFRTDSSFLFLFGPSEPGAAALLDPADGRVTLFLPARTEAAALWDGPSPSFEGERARLQVDRVVEAERLEEEVRAVAAGRPVAGLAVHDPVATELARRLTGEPLDVASPVHVGTAALVARLAELRLHKAEAELAEIRTAGEITRAAFLATMGATGPGVTERELAALLEYEFARHGGVPSYDTILSVRGEILHNHAHDGTLQDGDLVLLDAGAELASGWGCDITRTWPAGGRFTTEQRDLYGIVAAAFREAVGRIRPGESWRAVHLAAARVVAAGLVEFGVLKGDPDDLVERGAHAPFFPHGLGHHLGLDPHDFEHFGDRFLYAADRPRSPQFGLAYLRTDLDLEPGMVLTVEPGVYFSPAILAAHRERFRDAFVPARIEALLAANSGRGFGGIRLEDDFVVTETGCEDLTPGIPFDPDEVEAAVGTARAAAAGRVE